MKIVRKLRESTKSILIDKAISNGIDFSYTVDAVPGKVHLINLFIKNPYNRDEIFKAYIEDSDGMEYASEFQLINNLDGEWEYWLDNSSHRIRPEDTSIVSQYNDFILKPN